MKKHLLIIAALSALALTGCKKQAEAEDTISVSLEVTDIQDNHATVKAQLTSGKFYGAKLIEMVNLDDVTIDYSSDIQLVNYVNANGTDIELPYENTIEKIKIGQDKFTAIIVFDNNGRAAVAEKVIWTPAGLPEGWSTENNPGELEGINW